jgi:dihydrofolate reductase
MRKIVNSTYISLDGVVDHMEGWPPVPASDDEERRYGIQNDLLQSCDILIMGRRTYEGFAPAWSARSGDPVSDRFNAMRKYVVSSTLTDPGVRVEQLAGDRPRGGRRPARGGRR